MTSFSDPNAKSDPTQRRDRLHSADISRRPARIQSQVDNSSAGVKLQYRRWGSPATAIAHGNREPLLMTPTEQELPWGRSPRRPCPAGSAASARGFLLPLAERCP